MSKLRLSFACGPYDRTQALRDGTITPEGIDLVYVPLVTPLLRAAMARNLRTADGLGMLLRQAVPQFQLWFGKTPEITNE